MTPINKMTTRFVHTCFESLPAFWRLISFLRTSFFFWSVTNTIHEHKTFGEFLEPNTVIGVYHDCLSLSFLGKKYPCVLFPRNRFGLSFYILILSYKYSQINLAIFNFAEKKPNFLFAFNLEARALHTAFPRIISCVYVIVRSINSFSLF